MKRMMIVSAVALMLAGCESYYVGASLPVPGPVKPHVGASVSKSGLRGHAGASAKVGQASVGVGGSTKPVKLEKQQPAKQKPAEQKSAEKKPAGEKPLKQQPVKQARKSSKPR